MKTRNKWNDKDKDFFFIRRINYQRYFRWLNYPSPKIHSRVWQALGEKVNLKEDKWNDKDIDIMKI